MLVHDLPCEQAINLSSLTKSQKGICSIAWKKWKEEETPFFDQGFGMKEVKKRKRQFEGMIKNRQAG